MFSSTTPLSLPKETSLKLSELKKKTDLLVNYNFEKRPAKQKQEIENKSNENKTIILNKKANKSLIPEEQAISQTKKRKGKLVEKKPHNEKGFYFYIFEKFMKLEKYYIHQNEDQINSLEEEEEEEGDFLKNDKVKGIKQGTFYDILQKNEMKSRLFLVEWEEKKDSYFSGQDIMMYAPELMEELQKFMEY